ncbi:MAG: hypothetical protein AAGH41_09450 [Pseudomonadota bacterium]
MRENSFLRDALAAYFGFFVPFALVMLVYGYLLDPWFQLAPDNKEFLLLGSIFVSVVGIPLSVMNGILPRFTIFAPYLTPGQYIQYGWAIFFAIGLFLVFVKIVLPRM